MIENKKIPYYGISSGKFRRYRSWKNLTDPFRVLHGFFQARRLLGRIRPNVVFSKGGFVSVPVVMAAKTRHIPVIIHESDLTPGLANKLAMPSLTKVCCNFPETLPYLPKEKPSLPDLRSVRNFYTAISRQPKISADLPATCLSSWSWAAASDPSISTMPSVDALIPC